MFTTIYILGYLAANSPENAHKGGRAIKYLKVCVIFKRF